MSFTDALTDHVPQVPQHGHEWERIVVCMVNTQCVTDGQYHQTQAGVCLASKKVFLILIIINYYTQYYIIYLQLL